MKIKKVFDLIKKLRYILNTQQKLLCFSVIVLTLIAALFECVGVSIIVPLVNLIISPEILYQSEFIRHISILEKWGYSGLVYAIVATVIIVYVIKNSFFIFLSWFRIKFACKIQREIAIKMMKSYMCRGYGFFLNTNYGELSRGVSGDTSSVYSVLSAGFRLLADMITIVLICIYMIFSDFILSMSVVVMSLVCILLIYFVFRKNMYKTGEEIRIYGARAGQALYQAFQGIKDVLILRKQKHFVTEYEQNIIKVQVAQCHQTVGVEAPAYIIEGLCVSGIMVVVGLKIVMGGNNNAFVATLASFAVGAFRILPSLGRISISLNQMIANIPSINAVYQDIIETEHYVEVHPEAAAFEKEYESTGRINIHKGFEREIKLDNISFRYMKDGPMVLNGVNLIIRKGQSIGIKGTSGAGKSTLIDVLLGLLVPSRGRVTIDDNDMTDNPEKWGNIIGYVSQSIFLCDSSIRENVAFGLSAEEIDDEKVRIALERANMWGFVKTLDNGIDTFVGDRGIRLSGGQRQRIAIARALYHNPEILVLDEATSALDNETESTIMNAIDSLQGTITMVIVAHRLSTIKNCDVVYEVVGGKVFPIDRNSII